MCLLRQAELGGALTGWKEGMGLISFPLFVLSSWWPFPLLFLAVGVGQGESWYDVINQHKRLALR